MSWTNAPVSGLCMLGVAERNALHYYYNDGGSMYLARVQAMHLLVMLVRASMKRKLGMTIKMPLMLCKDVLMQWGRYLMLMIVSTHAATGVPALAAVHRRTVFISNQRTYHTNVRVIRFIFFLGFFL